MINLTQDTNDSFSEYKAAVDRKTDDSIEKMNCFLLRSRWRIVTSITSNILILTILKI